MMNLSKKQAAHLRKRQKIHRLFRFLGQSTLWFALSSLIILLVSVGSQSFNAMSRTMVKLDIDLSAREQAKIIKKYDADSKVILSTSSFKKAVYKIMPEIESRSEKRLLSKMISYKGAKIYTSDYIRSLDKDALVTDLSDGILSVWVPADDQFDLMVRGKGPLLDPNDPMFALWQKAQSSLSQSHKIRQDWNTAMLTSPDSSDPELAGLWGSIIGSILTMSVTLVFALPMGVMAAIYLEEFAPKNRFMTLIEVNINNLAAIPSVLFGLLGLIIYIQLFGLPRSTPLVGGLVLGLMTLPTIIISTRIALSTVPASIKDAALALGASHFQSVFHHVVPLSLPGIMTGTIIGMSRALGETAPLLMIGMVAFIADIPSGPTSPASVLPVQIFLWAGKQEHLFVFKTAAAIIILLLFLMCMNACAVYIRKKFEHRWG